MPTDVATTKLLIEARKTAVELVELIESEAKCMPPAFVRRVWAIVQQRSVDQIGLPRRPGAEIDPMNDRQAERFAEVPMPFGIHAGTPIGMLYRDRPEYLANIADGTPFTKELKRYLARDKYSSEETET